MSLGGKKICQNFYAETTCLVFSSFVKGSPHRPKNKIIDGFETPHDSLLYQFTVQVISQINENDQFKCGGSLLSPNYVLTAAHCAKNMTPVEVLLQIPAGLKKVRYEVSSFIFHPKFPLSGLFPEHDFAILKLAASVREATYFPCLPKDNKYQFVGNNMLASGWGQTRPDDPSTSDALKSAFLVSMSNDHCSKIHTDLFNKGSPSVVPVFVPAGIICAVAPGNNSTASICQGDTGGWLDKKCFFIIIFFFGGGGTLSPIWQSCFGCRINLGNSPEQKSATVENPELSKKKKKLFNAITIRKGK